MFADFPIFSLVRISADEKGQKLFGQLSSTMKDNHKWIDDEWVGFIADSSRFIYGRWLKADGGWHFRPAEPVDDLAEGHDYIAVDGFWGERIEHMFPPITWIPATFLLTDSSCHDHCFYCWATISDEENAEHMKSNKGEVACNDCFERFVKPRSFEFICYPDTKI